MKFRLILDKPRSGTLNMAIDEMLMEAQELPAASPALRIYSWDTPCRTLGYFQSIDEQRKRGKGPLVRRITGGGLVSHGKDVTFSLTLKESELSFMKDVKTSYLKVNEALRHGLRSFLSKLEYADCKTVPAIGQKNRHSDSRVCFEAPACYDLLLEKRKVVGASQRRKKGVLLHQSSVFLEIPREKVIEGMLQGFKEKWGMEFEEKPLSEQELSLSVKKESERYSSPEWAAI